MGNNWFNSPAEIEFNCYGLSLSPLCVGHLFLLREIKSPYLCEELQCEADLRLAAVICSAPWSESRHFLRNRSHGFFRLVWKLLSVLTDFEKQNSIFCSYLAAHQTGIPTKSKISHPGLGVDTYESPYEWIVLSSLMDRLNLPYSEAMNIPVWVANRIITVQGELRGEIDIVSDELAALFDRVERERVKVHARASSESAH